MTQLRNPHLHGVASALVDGELPHGARERALVHLAGCASCRAQVEAERAAKRWLSRATTPAVPGDLLLRLREMADPGDPLPPRRRGVAGSGRRPALPAPGHGGRRTRTVTVGPQDSRPAGVAYALTRPGPAARARRRRLRRVGAATAGVFSVGGLALAAVVALGAPPPTGEPAAPAATFSGSSSRATVLVPRGSATAGSMLTTFRRDGSRTFGGGVSPASLPSSPGR